MTPAITEPTTIEDLDFPVPCTHSQHEIYHVLADPAAYRVRFNHPECGHSAEYMVCMSGWRQFVEIGRVFCSGCLQQGLPFTETVRIIEVLR